MPCKVNGGKKAHLPAMPPKPEPDLDMACQAALGMLPCAQGAVSS